MGGRAPIDTSPTPAPNPDNQDIGIAFTGVRKAFGEVLALEDVTFEIERHARIGIVGPSGGGKSTLLQLTAGLLEPDAGGINVEGETSATGRLARCAMMPQRDLLLPWRTALDNAMIALQNRGVSRNDARAKTRPFFEHFGLAQFEDVLSGQTLRRHAAAGQLPADADGRERRPAARRAVRCAGLDHPCADAGVALARARATSRARCCSSRTTWRRRSCSAARSS